jgi:hypothetical protein
MLRRNGLVVSSLILFSGLLPGCASFGIRDGIPYFSKREQWEPPEEEDKWASVGRQGRGGKALDDERDPLKKMLMSKEAQDIERNLGYQ